MCGIVGFTGPGPSAEYVLRDMMTPILHRGPDDDGVFVDDAVAFGHLRLTIVDLHGGSQPRHDPTSGDLLVYNGEIYNYRDHARDLTTAGVTLRDASDTEVLFQMIRRHGVPGALERIDGMFAFAYRNGRTGTVSLARDRFGEKPLFYGVIDGQLVFASELKALRRHPLCAEQGFDLEAIGQYLSFDYVPAPRTGYRNIRKLAPGCLLTFDDGEMQSTAYWQLPFPAPTAKSDPVARDERSAIGRLEGLLTASIEARLIADVPVGLFLSGGIDSALIAALASRLAPGIAAYTIKLPGDGYDETPFATQVAETFGLSHAVREVTAGEVLAALDRIEERIDEPFADPSIVPTYLLCETARQGVKVALSGDGGDELFAGYINFQARQLSHVMAAIPSWLATAARRTISTLPASDRYMSLPFKLAQLAQGFGQPEVLQSFCWMAPFDAAARRRLVKDGIPAAETFIPVTERLAARSPSSGLDTLQYLFASLYLPDDILTKVDRASMYHSLEVRAPFLSGALADFALHLPEFWRVRGFQTKFLLRRLAARYLPRGIVRRPKHGFALPIAGLMRGALRTRMYEVLLDPGNPLAQYFHRPEIERMLASHMMERADHRKRLWSLYCLFQFGRASLSAGAHNTTHAA